MIVPWHNGVYRSVGTPQPWQLALAQLSLKWQDNFTGGALDPTIWTPSYFGADMTSISEPVQKPNAGHTTGEDAVYDPVQVSVAGGYCLLTTRNDPNTLNGRSYAGRTGCISTLNKKTLTPPYAFERRIWFDPLSPGVCANWQVAWLNGYNPPSWPDCGENDDAENSAAGQIGSNFHKASSPGVDSPIGVVAYPGDTTGWHKILTIHTPSVVYWVWDDGAYVRTWNGPGITTTPLYGLITNAVPAVNGSRAGLLKWNSTMMVDYARAYGV